MELPINLKNEIWDYCRANNISNIDDFVLKLVKQGFTVEKYGATPAVTSALPIAPPSVSATTATTETINKTETRTDLYGEDN